MHAALAAIGVAVVAFAGTMADNFVAFAAQLAITDRRHHERAALGQLLGVVALIVISVGVSTALGEIPIQWVGVLAIAPALLAVHAWRHRGDAATVVKRGFVATLIVTIAFGGDNIAVWVPIFRAAGAERGIITVIVFVVADVILIALARLVASHPRVVATGARVAPLATPFLYGALAIVILWQCHWF